MVNPNFRKHLYEMPVSGDLTKPEYDRITVWAQTLQHFKDIPDAASIVYRQEYPIPLERLEADALRRYTTTQYDVWNMDCVYAAEKLLAEGHNPLLLNMADWDVAGGCVDTGSSAQEEELFRRSNYHKLLLQDYYPLGLYDTIYTPAVHFFRKGSKDGYVQMETPVTISCVAAPALRFPRVDRATGRYASSTDVAKMEAKIRMLFWVAALHGHDSLVLSAWGCGAFGCPPVHTAEIFKRVCYEMAGRFKRVVFAILGPNYAPFESVFKGQ